MKNFRDCSSTVRAPPCHGGSCGFESRQSRSFTLFLVISPFVPKFSIWEQVVTRQFFSENFWISFSFRFLWLFCFFLFCPVFLSKLRFASLVALFFLKFCRAIQQLLTKGTLVPFLFSSCNKQKSLVKNCSSIRPKSQHSIC